MSKQFAEFRLGDLFEVEGSRSTDAGTLHLTSDDAFPFIGRTSTNNGIQGFCGNLGFPANSAGEISISQVGTIDAQWRGTPYYTSQNIVRCRAKRTHLSLQAGLYIIAILKKHLSGFVGYTTPKAIDIKKFEIKLPVTDVSANTNTPEPDWEYMENYIKTIERKYIDQIAQVNAREQEILTQLYPESVTEKPEAHGFEEFRVGDIFNITPTSYYKSTPPSTSDLAPQVTNTTQPNGISSFEPHAPNNEKNVITFSDTTVGGETLFYQPVDFLGYSHIQKMTSPETTLTKRKAMYVVTAFKKAVNGVYDYGTKFNRDNAAQTFIHLPVTSAGDIDWDYMEKYVAWIETQERERVESYVRHARRRS